MQSRKGTRRGTQWVGTEPKDADGVIYAGDDVENAVLALAGWAIYRRAAGAAPWVNMKIVRLGSGKGAANYWTSWHTGERRFHRAFGTQRIPEAMRREIEGVMREVYPQLAEADMVDELARVRMLA